MSPGEPPEVPVAGDVTAAERVERGLAILRASDPACAALLEEHYLAGVPMRQLERETGVDRRRLTRQSKQALELLGLILDDLP